LLNLQKAQSRYSERQIVASGRRKAKLDRPLSERKKDPAIIKRPGQKKKNGEAKNWENKKRGQAHDEPNGQERRKDPLAENGVDPTAKSATTFIHLLKGSELQLVPNAQDLPCRRRKNYTRIEVPSTATQNYAALLVSRGNRKGYTGEPS